MDTNPYLTTIKTVAQTETTASRRQICRGISLGNNSPLPDNQKRSHRVSSLFKLARCTTTCQAMVETPSPSDDSLSLRAWCLALDFDAYIMLCHTALLPFICLLPFLSFLFLSFPSQAVTAQARGLFATTIGGCRACAAIQQHGGDKKRMNGEDGNESRERAYRQAIDTGREGMAGRVKTGLG